MSRLTRRLHVSYVCLFFTGTPTTAIYTLSLHDALPISAMLRDNPLGDGQSQSRAAYFTVPRFIHAIKTFEDSRLVFIAEDRKSTRLNSSHRCISYAVFCLKKKKTVS